MMHLSQRSRRDLSLLLVGLIIVGLGVWFVAPAGRPKVSLRISAGSAVGTRHALALELKQLGQSQQLDLQIVPTDGSEHALREIQAGKLDLAFVQGGLIDDRYSHVKQVAPLHVEPLHLLVTSELSLLIERDGLAALGGRVINVSTAGSGTQALAMSLLTFLGLRPANYAQGSTSVVDSKKEPWPDIFRATQLSYDQLLEVSEKEQLPEAIFSISSLPSSFAREMIERHGYKLVTLPFSDAFALNAFAEAQPASSPGAIEKSFDQSRVFEASIPAFTYSVRLKQPPQSLTTIGTRLLLVAHERVPDAIIERLLTILFESPITKNARPPIEMSIMETAPEYAWHSGAATFIAHHKPLIAGAFVELTANALAIGGSVLGGAYFLFQWLRRRRQHSVEAEFRIYLNAVLEVEKQLLAFDAHGSIHVSELVKLHQRLIELKREVAHRFFSGELDGQALMLGFMTMTNDVRNHIARMLLHERENVEELANQQQSNVEVLWNDRLHEDDSGQSDSDSDHSP